MTTPYTEVAQGSDPPLATESASPSTRLERAAELFQVVAALECVLNVTSPGHPQLLAIDNMGQALLQDLRQLLRLSAGSEAFEKTLSRFESVAGSAEQQLLEIDAQVSKEDFNIRFHGAEFKAETLARYAASLARSVSAEAERSERLEAVAYRVLTRKVEGHKTAVYRRNDVQSLLLYITGGVRAEASPRASALGFFESAARRLQDIHRVPEIFTSDFYFDLHGFKIALREAIVDADVLYGTVRISAALLNRLKKLALEENYPDEILIERISCEQERLSTIFQSIPENPAVPRFEWLKKEKKKRKYRSLTWEEYSKRVGIIEIGSKLRRRFLWAVACFAGVAAIAQMVTFLGVGNQRLIAYESEDLADISPYLERARYSSGEPRVLVGYMISSKWRVLSGADRRSVANGILEKLKSMNVSAGLFFCDNQPVVQIEKSEVVFVR